MEFVGSTVAQVGSAIRRLIRYRRGAPKVLVAVLAIGSLGGCYQTTQTVPRVQVSQLAPYSNAAKGPGCSMPVLYERPAGGYTEVAIVEGWAAPEQSEQLLEELKRRACETGADALVVVEKQAQVTQPHLYRATPNETSEEASGAEMSTTGYYVQKEEHMPKVGEAGHSGYYMDAIAIVYNHSRHDTN